MKKVKKNRHGEYVFEEGKKYVIAENCLYTEADPEDTGFIMEFTKYGFKVDLNGNIWLPKNTPLEFVGYSEDYGGWPTFRIAGYQEDYEFSSLEDYTVFECPVYDEEDMTIEQMFWDMARKKFKVFKADGCFTKAAMRYYESVASCYKDEEAGFDELCEEERCFRRDENNNISL